MGDFVARHIEHGQFLDRHETIIGQAKPPTSNGSRNHRNLLLRRFYWPFDGRSNLANNGDILQGLRVLWIPVFIIGDFPEGGAQVQRISQVAQRNVSKHRRRMSVLESTEEHYWAIGYHVHVIIAVREGLPWQVFMPRDRVTTTTDLRS